MNDLVERMNQVWLRSGLESGDPLVRMAAAAKVLLDARDAQWINAVAAEVGTLKGFGKDASAIFADYVKARLLAPKTPEERITVGMVSDGWYVEKDGVLLQDKLKEGIAKAARRGLIAEMKGKA